MALVGFSDAVSPAGETDDDSDTGPEKLLRLVRVIEDVPDEPDCNVRVDGLPEMLKSGEVPPTETV